jgi:tRNA(Ile)-lysidine synthase
MIRRIAQFVEEQELFSRDARIVVGISGGPDSMALLYLLLALNAEQGYQLELHVAHLHHGLRAHDADADAAFVAAAADASALPCTIEHCDVPKLQSAEGGSIEEIARRERYAFFARICAASGARTIAVGHHADDNAETVLHRIIRGTGVRGIAGISPKRTMQRGSDLAIVRPLLGLGRGDILRYLANAGIAYHEDETNASHDGTRNRIRNELLPRLETDYNPQVREALLRLAEQARWVDQYIRETVEKTFRSLIISRTDQELVLNASALARKGRIVQAELVRHAIVWFDVGEQDLTFGHLKGVTDLIADQVSGKQVTLPGGMTAQLVYNRLVISMLTAEPRESIAEQVAIHLPGKTVLPVRRIEIECEVHRINMEGIGEHLHNRDRFEEWLDLDNVRPPLVVRSRQPGDRFWPLGAPGSKKVSDFLSDLKVDPQERERVAVLCDQLGPIWIIGHRIDDRAKLSRITREALRVRARYLDD